MLASQSYLTDAAYRFYRTKCEEESAVKRGISGNKQKKKRQHERLSRVSQQLLDIANYL